MNIYDISQRAGVSIATVSRVLNGSSRVSESTRKRVEQVMAACGYTPNAFARGLGLGSMKTVGLLCADLADPYLAQAMAYLEAFLRERGYDCLLGCGQDAAERHKMLELLLNKHVDGLILVGSGLVESDPALNQPILEAARRLPVVILGAALEGAGIYSVFCDDRGATEDAVTRLLAQGYRDALAQAGVPEDPALIRLMAGERANPAEVRDALMRLHREGLRFDAVMTSDDKLAQGALKYALKAGVSVPGELSIVGFNDSNLACCCEPELSSVDNKLRSQCLQCAESLTAVLAGKDVPKRAVFSGELIRRGTTP